MLQLDYAYTRHAHRRVTQPHFTAIILVGGLHVILAIGLINALKDVQVAEVPDRIVTDFVPADPTDETLPPPPQPDVFEPPPPTVPTFDDVVIIERPPGPSTAITEPRLAPPPGTDVVPLPLLLTPPRGIVETQTGPTYPVISRRLREEGMVRLRLTIGTDGRVIAADVIESSGHMRLDDAAVDWVLRRWRYEPAMQGSMPVEAITEAILNFELR